MKTKHTQGPWWAKLNGEIYKINGKDGNVCIIAHEADAKRDKQANARLIAAAPDLLQALEFIRADINDPLMDFDRMEIVNRYTKYINKVLAKAMGGAE